MRRSLCQAIDYATKTGSFSKLNIAHNSQNVCIFGAGRFFEEVFEQWHLKERLNVRYVCDNNQQKWGGVFGGVPCISPQELAQIPDAVAVPMVGANAVKAVECQLDDLKVHHINLFDVFFEILCDMPREKKWFAGNSIVEVFDMLSDDWSREVYANVLCRRIAPQFAQKSLGELFTDDEYFSSGFFPLSQTEVYIDCGAYNGDTIERFLKAVDHNFKEIYAFEVDTGNYASLLAYVGSLPENEQKNIHCNRAGVWNEPGFLTCGRNDLDSGESVGVFKTDNPFQVEVVRLDECLEASENMLIKMDIEGAELKALQGAENLIKKAKPKLAVCLYHRLEDFWAIPVYLKSLRPDYKFGVKHHQNGGIGGTVLYAW